MCQSTLSATTAFTESDHCILVDLASAKWTITGQLAATLRRHWPNTHAFGPDSGKSRAKARAASGVRTPKHTNRFLSKFRSGACWLHRISAVEQMNQNTYNGTATLYTLLTGKLVKKMFKLEQLLAKFSSPIYCLELAPVADRSPDPSFINITRVPPELVIWR